MKNELKKFKNYIQRNYKWIIFLFVISILTYSTKLFNYSISIDTEVPINNLNGNDMPWIATGRWGVVFLEKIMHFGHRYNPFLSNIIMILFFTGSVILFSYLISKIVKKEHLEKNILLIQGFFILTSPTIAEMLNFTLMSAEIAIGIFFVVLSTLCLYIAIYEKNKKSYLLSIVFLVIAMGEYQAFFPLFIGLVAIMFSLEKIFDSKNDKFKLDLINVVKMVVVFIISYIICSIITKVLEIHFNLNPSGYLTNQITWGKVPVSESINNIKNYIKMIMFPSNSSEFFNYSYLISCLIFIKCSIKLIKDRRKKSIVPILALAFVLITPFLLTILMGSFAVLRSQMILPFVISTFFTLYIVVSDNKTLNKVICLLCIIFGLIQFKYTSDLFYSDYIRYQEDVNLTQSIFDKIDNMDDLPESNRENVKVVFIGQHSAKSTGVVARGETFSYSFYEWDQSTKMLSNIRIYGLTQTLGYRYIMPTEEDVDLAKKNIKKLGVYPSKNSIKVIDDLVIVRLS